MSKYPETSFLSGTDQQGIVPAFSGWFTSNSRLRTVANVEQFSYNGYRYDTAPSFWISPETPIDGSIIHSSSDLGKTLSIGDQANSKIISQTRQRFVYNSGNSHVLTFAVNNSLQEGRVMKYGYFDENSGAFIKIKKTATGYEAWAVRRSNGIDTAVPESEWNIDSLNGIERSGEAIDFSKIQMFYLEFTWYGAGEVLLGYKINRRVVPIHCFTAGNTLNETIFNEPNLPVRFELYNEDGPLGVPNSTITTYGIHLGIEGSDPAQRFGFPRTYFVSKSVTSGNSFVLASIRPKLNFKGINNRSWWQISDVQISGTANGRLRIVYLPTLNTPSWIDVDTNNSFSEVDISSTTATGGINFYTILFSSNKGGDKIAFPSFKDALTPSSDGTETYYVSFIFESAGNGTIDLAINWTEKY